MGDPAPAQVPVLSGGRRVSLLPRSGGHSWAGTVRSWQHEGDHVVARIETAPEAVRDLDHHQVWLSTVSRNGDEHGITIFAGKAHAVEPAALELDGVVRLADEHRRRAVRAGGCEVTLPIGDDGRQQTVAATDVSRGGLRLPPQPGGWTFGDPLDLVLHLGGGPSVAVVGRLLRTEPDGSVVLALEELTAGAAAAIDRHALDRLPAS